MAAPSACSASIYRSPLCQILLTTLTNPASPPPQEDQMTRSCLLYTAMCGRAGPFIFLCDLYHARPYRIPLNISNVHGLSSGNMPISLNRVCQSTPEATPNTSDDPHRRRICPLAGYLFALHDMEPLQLLPLLSLAWCLKHVPSTP